MDLFIIHHQLVLDGSLLGQEGFLAGTVGPVMETILFSHSAGKHTLDFRYISIQYDMASESDSDVSYQESTWLKLIDI